MYFLIKDDKKANFNKFDEWKYSTFSDFSFFETFRRAFAPGGMASV